VANTARGKSNDDVARADGRQREVFENEWFVCFVSDRDLHAAAA
jgi:hypothetical protein